MFPPRILAGEGEGERPQGVDREAAMRTCGGLSRWRWVVLRCFRIITLHLLVRLDPGEPVQGWSDEKTWSGSWARLFPPAGRPVGRRGVAGGLRANGAGSRLGDQPRRGRRPRSSKSERGRTKPGKTAPPSSAWLARTRADFSIVEKTRAVRFLGSISQTSRTPASKYSRTLRAISALVFPSLSTSTARSGARSGIGSRGLSRPGSLLPGDERQVGNPHQAGSDPHHAVRSDADPQVVLIEIRTDPM